MSQLHNGSLLWDLSFILYESRKATIHTNPHLVWKWFLSIYMSMNFSSSSIYQTFQVVFLCGLWLKNSQLGVEKLHTNSIFANPFCNPWLSGVWLKKLNSNPTQPKHLYGSSSCHQQPMNASNCLKRKEDD